MTVEEVEKPAPRTETLDKCPICNSKRTSFFFSSPDRLHGTPGVFNYETCKNCKTVFQNPMVVEQDLHLCYPAEYTPYNYKQDISDVDFDRLPDGSFRDALRKAIVCSVRGKKFAGRMGRMGEFLSKSTTLRERAFYGIVIDDLLPKGPGRHKALDLGCGAGWMMKKLQLVGWDVEGLEWNEAAADVARNETGLNVWAGDFRQIDIPKAKYDLVLLNHVFEHFRDSTDILLRVNELLTAGGRVVLFYPSPFSLGAKWNKTNWFPWEVPRHLVFPTPQAIRAIAKKCGFPDVAVKTRAYYPEVHWLWSKAYRKGKNPETDKTELGVREWVGVTAEKMLTLLGLDMGWEIVAVLKK